MAPHESEVGAQVRELLPAVSRHARDERGVQGEGRGDLSAGGGVRANAPDIICSLFGPHIFGAITYLTKAVVIYPAYSNAWMLLGNAYFGLYNSPDTAIYYYKKAIAYNDTYMDAYYNIGYLLTGKKNREAISAFKQVLVSNPKHLESLYHMALCYKNIQLMDSALYCLDQIKGINTNSLKVYQLAGLIYGETNQIDKAIIELSKAVEMDSEQAENYLNLGIAYGKKADWENAISVLNKASQLAPENANIWMALGVTFQNAGNMLKANENFEKAFSLNPSLKNRH